MPDYQKGKIYRIISPSKNLVYYGSTIQTLNQRLAEHIKRYKYYNDVNYQKRKEYCKSYIVLECEDYKIELVEEYPCNNRQQLLRKEGEYMKNNTCVNTSIAGRTDKEYYDDNREKLIQKTKDWYEENKQQKAEYDKKYREDNAEKKAEQARIYQANNKEKLKEYRKAYYEKHKNA